MRNPLRSMSVSESQRVKKKRVGLIFNLTICIAHTAPSCTWESAKRLLRSPVDFLIRSLSK